MHKPEDKEIFLAQPMTDEQKEQSVKELKQLMNLYSEISLSIFV
ncbi:hypothetical protein [Staphylococcus equorum]|nr:hypothetical protein [Staphylococcus equorum]